MTEDTRRALGIIEPLARELHIKVRADEYELYLNGQAIGISDNSTHATIMEFIGYLVFVWAKDKREKVPTLLERRIKRYWYSKEQAEQFRAAREEYAKTRRNAGNDTGISI